MTERDADPLIPTDPAAVDASGADDELLAELADDYSSRVRRGQRTTVEEYARRYPQLGERIRNMFAAIAAIEESRPFDLLGDGDQSGSVVGRYKLLERIGEGGFGVVFMAEQQVPVRRRVAIKLIKAGLDTKQVIARFEAERQALAMMDHANIAKVLDAGATETGRPYFVMELVHGVPITEYCDANRLSPRQRLELFVPVCRAVQHAHTKGIIHRDIKPTNVLVMMHDGVAVSKVIDFGVAKATGLQPPLTERTLFTQFAQMVGTPLYMSPEQAEMSGLDVDTRSDVYSLGVLLYELLTGTTPFDQERLKRSASDEVRRIIREEEPPRPSTRVSTFVGEKLATVSARRKTEPARMGQLLRGELDWIVMKALEKDRARRYETPNALAADVQQYLADAPVRACPPSVAYRFRKFARRNKALLLTGVAISLVLVLATAISSWQAVRARVAERAARDYAAELALDKGQLLGESGETNLALLWLARSLHLAPPDAVDLHVTIRTGMCAWQRQVDSLRLVLPHDGRVAAVGFGADGWPVTASAESGTTTVRRWNVNSSRPGAAVSFPGDPTEQSSALSPSGEHILLGDGTVRMKDLASGKTVWEARADEHAFVTCMVFSPDGRTALVGYDVEPVGALPPSGKVKLFEAATGKELGPPLEHRRPVHAAAFHPDGVRFVTACGTWGDVAVGVETRFWDLQGRETRERLPHTSFSPAVAFSPDGTRLLTGHWDRKGMIWDLTGPTAPVVLQHEGPVVSVAFSPDGKAAVTGSFDGSVRVWDAGGRLLGPPLRQGRMVDAVAFGRDGKSVIVANRSGVVRLWSLGAGAHPGPDAPPDADVVPLAISPDGRTILTQDARHAVVLRDAVTHQPVGKPLPVQRALRHGGTSVPYGQRHACSSDRRRALTVEEDDDARLWDVPTGTLLAELEPDPRGSKVFAAAFSPDSTLLTTGNFYWKAHVWDAATGELRRQLEHGPDGPVFSVVFSPDGKALASTGADNAIRFWNPATGEALGPPLLHSTTVITLAFSPDGRTLVTGDLDSNVQLRDAATRRQLLQLSGHRGGITDAAFGPDGTWVLTGSHDGTARLWNAATGKPIGPPLPHAGPLVRVAFSRDGRTILTATHDQVTRSWPVPTPVGGAAGEIERWAQVATGMELEANGGARVLDAAEWKARRQELQRTGPPTVGVPKSDATGSAAGRSGAN